VNPSLVLNRTIKSLNLAGRHAAGDFANTKTVIKYGHQFPEEIKLWKLQFIDGSRYDTA
jgi:hypothetical protein